jgi:hypothetical protein
LWPIGDNQIGVIGSRNPNEPCPKSRVAIGALSGVLNMAFSSTIGITLLKAEVYGAAMFLMMYCAIELLLVEQKSSASSANIWWPIVYLSFLSIGIHHTTFLVVPSFFSISAMINIACDYRFVGEAYNTYDCGDLNVFFFGGSWRDCDFNCRR